MKIEEIGVPEKFKEKDLKDIAKLFSKKFNSKWSEKDILKIKKNYNFCIIRQNNTIKAIMTYRILDKNKTDKNIKYYIVTNKFIMVSDLASEIKGGGSALLKYLDKFKIDIYLTSWKTNVVPFYEKCGFIFCKKFKDKDHRLVLMKYAKKKKSCERKDRSELLKEENKNFQNYQIKKWIEEAYDLLYIY